MSILSLFRNTKFNKFNNREAQMIDILRPEFFYFLFYRFFQPDVRVGGRKKNKNKIQCRLFFFPDISDVKVGGSKKKKKDLSSFP